jgi:23S rRNA (guanine745-N1)-methyltransferase
MKKIEKGTAFLQQHLDLFRCTVDGEPYTEVEGHSLVCAHGHRLDLNKKGSLVFLNHAVNTEYDDAMLAARRRVLTAGLFDGIIDAVNEALPDNPQTIMDVGTGEGTPLVRLLDKRGNKDVGVGFDISKAGVNLATQLDSDAFFAVADLANLPFNDQSFDDVIEFFSPSAYEEFERVLKPGGRIVKVVPGQYYLRELRRMLYPADSPNHTYSNEKVVARFLEKYPDTQIREISYTWQIPADLYVDLLHMTPLHWGARPEAQLAAESQPIPSVTVNIVVLVAKKDSKAIN